MEEKTTTMLLIGVVAVVFLATVYLLTKPKPQTNDLSADELGGLIVKGAEIYYGM